MIALPLGGSERPVVDVRDDCSKEDVMEQFLTMVCNWKTTLTGVASAVVIYMMGVGNKLPENKQEWTNAVLGVAAILLGLAAKDATTGSRPS